jgi:A/G-specific adenine glycosylase
VHVLTHKDLRLSPMRLALSAKQAKTLGLHGDGAWFGRGDWTVLGLPAPIRKLLG